MVCSWQNLHPLSLVCYDRRMFLIKFLQNKQMQPKMFTYICLSVLLLLGLLQIFMVFVVLPHQGGFMNLHIPTRSGGIDLHVDGAQFTLVGSIALAVGIIATALVVGLNRLGKSTVTVAITFLLLASAIFYVALYIGSAFSALWGGGPATVGVLGVIAIGMALELPLLVWMNQNFKKK